MMIDDQGFLIHPKDKAELLAFIQQWDSDALMQSFLRLDGVKPQSVNGVVRATFGEMLAHVAMMGAVHGMIDGRANDYQMSYEPGHFVDPPNPLPPSPIVRRLDIRIETDDDDDSFLHDTPDSRDDDNDDDDGPTYYVFMPGGLN